jgi:hypothetical protein
MEGGNLSLDVHHARLGNLGEDNLYPRIMLENARKLHIEGMEFLAPSIEDQLLLLGMQKVYGRRHLRLCDLLWAMATIRKESLDWDYVVGSARRLSIFAGLCCYLSYVDQVYQEIYGTSLLGPELRRALLREDWGRVQFRDGYYRYPVLAVSGRLYVRKLAAMAANGNWESAGRLCLLPLLGLVSVLGRLGSRA